MTKRPRSKYNNPQSSQPAPRGSAKPKPRKPFQRGKSGPQSTDNVLLYGIHAVRAALTNPQRKRIRLYASENALSRLGHDIVEKSRVEIALVDPRELDRMVAADAVHQGAILACEPLNALDASELFHLADKKLILVLDQLTDPHNVGAILRSAAAFAVDAVIMTHRNSAQETGALAKAASGALDLMPVIEVRNLSKALEELNGMGFASFGLDSEGPLVLEETLQTAKPKKAILVLGAEGKGLREKTRETCSHLARLDMPGEIKSLNVSNAAALSLYVVRQALN